MKKRALITALALGSLTQAHAAGNFQATFNEYLAAGYNYSYAQQLATAQTPSATDNGYASLLNEKFELGYERAFSQQLATAELHEPVDEVYRQLLLSKLNQGYEHTYAQQLASVEYRAEQTRVAQK